MPIEWTFNKKKKKSIQFLKEHEYDSINEQA
jgi:hypothetical protein